MILDQMYPTAWTGSGGNAYTTEINNGSNFLPVTVPDFTDAYYLGYISGDDIPSTLRITKADFQNGVYIFTDRTIAENVDIGFLGRPSTISLNVAADRAGSFYKYDGTRWARWSNTVDYDGTMSNYGRLPNDININTFSVKSIYLCIAVAISTAEDADATTAGICRVIMSLDDFIFKTASITMSADNTAFFGASVPYSITISLDDLDGTVKNAENGGYFVKFALCYYSPNEYMRDIKPDSTGADYDHVTPFFRMHADFDGVTAPYVIASNAAVGREPTSAINGGGYRFNFSWGLDISSHTYDVTSGRYLAPGGYVGTAPQSDVTSKCSGKYNILAPDDANFFFQGTARNDFCMIRRVYSYDEVYKHLSLMPRWTTADNTYDNAASKYYSLVDGLRFMCDFANGVRDRARLTDWELIGGRLDPETSTYDPADKPPYTPEDDDTPQNVGASISRPSTLGVGGTSGFITQYVLTAAEIATLGRTLWTSFINPDYWKNFLFSLALDTGSFDMSSLLDYFVSLRVYPFSLINVPSYAATGSPSIYVGSGMVPLTITGSTTLHTINNFADYIDAGLCTVHSAYFHDDFRDFSNVEIMLYLPYCGTVQLNPGDVVGGTLHAQYAIDFATGGCVAYVDLTSADGISYPIAVLPGSIGADVPLTATNAGQIAARFAGDVINFASTVSSNAASDLNARASAATGAITGGASGALSRSSGIGAIATGGINAGLQHASQALDMATRPAIGIPTLSGGRGFSSFGAPQTAYIQIRRGIYKRPQTYDHTVGFPASASKTIGSLSGLVKGAVDTAGLSCTADESAEVRTLIAAGIIV